MTFREYWNRLVSKNAGLKDEESKMTISVGSFKRQIEKAYANGAKDKAAVAKEFKKAVDKPDPFKDLFGMFKQGPTE